MIQASLADKALVIDILSESFDSNKSINYVVKQDKKRETRIKGLMDYSFNYCYEFGKVWLNDDKTACALILYNDKKKTTLKSILWDIKLALNVITPARVPKVLGRESKIKKFHPNEPFLYLWFIGVRNKDQGKGLGTQLLQEIEAENSRKRAIYLETSTERNLPFYERFGFQTFNEVDLSYRLYMMKKAYS